MKWSIVWTVLICAAAPALWAAPPIFYVAANGNDAWTGTLPEPNGSDGPFATLHQAQQALRARGPAEGGAVYVREGTYYLPKPLRFEAADSGAPDKEVLWQSYRGEKVRLLPARRIEGFTPFKDAILQCNLEPFGLAGKPCQQLFFKSARQILARWPNKGADALPGGGWAFIAAPVENDRSASFHYADDRPAQWKSAEGAQISIWPNYNWWQTIEKLGRIDTASKIITLEHPLSYTIEPGRRYFYQNVFEELDAPGEWFCDTKSGILYFWPPEPIEGAEVVIPIEENAVVFDHAKHITFLGFSIEATGEDGISVKESEECLLAKNLIRNTGGWGLVIDGGTHVRAVGNDICNTGRGGISLSGGDRKTLTPGRHEAVNNHIHHFAEIYQTYHCGVNVSGVANIVAHNLIHDAPHIGILLGGNDHIIEYNEIHHVCMEASDNGAFYMGRDWTQRGNIIRYNAFHDIYGFGLAGLAPDASGVYNYQAPDGAWGIYLDDCSSGTTILGNLFYRVPLCGVMIGGGRDNAVTNNVFVDSIPALHIDARWDAYCWDVMQERLNAMNYKEPPYSVRYPELLAMGDDPRRPANNSFVRNIVYYTRDDYRGLSSTKPGAEAVVYDLNPFDPGSTKFEANVIFHKAQFVRIAYNPYKAEGASTLTWEDWVAKGFDALSQIEDPRFFNLNEDDYQLRIDSVAIKMGFKRLPLSQIGLYQDEFRCSWPVPKDTRKEGSNHQVWPIQVTPPAAPAAPAAN